MKKLSLFFPALFFVFCSCASIGFSSFGQTEARTVKKLEGDYIVERMCIAPKTVRWNMSELWLSKTEGAVALVGNFNNPSRFSKANIPFQVDEEIYTLKGSNSYDVEVWGYTSAYAGAGGTLFTVNVFVVLTDDILSRIKNSNRIRIDMSVPSQERFETIEGADLEKVKSFLN